ncbi:MAG: acyltransferase family protein [Eubacteriaceae bacterium]
MLKSKDRDSYFDNCKYLLILFVVLGHAIEPLIKSSSIIFTAYSIMYLFHMPCFIFITGYFMRRTKNISKAVIKYTKIYIIVQTIYFIVIKYFMNYASIKLTYSNPYFTYWFLFALISWYIVFPYLKDIKSFIFISIILGILIGYDTAFGRFLSASRIMFFMPFFAFGYYGKKEWLLYLKNSKLKYLIVFFCICLAIFIYNDNTIINRSLLYGYQSYKAMGFDVWYAGFYRLVVYILQIIFSLTFFLLIPEKKMFYSNFGKNTLYPYVTHGIILKCMQIKGFYDIAKDELLYQILLIIFSIVYTTLLCTFRIKLHKVNSIPNANS